MQAIRSLSPSIPLRVADCASLVDSYPELGCSQGAVNRRINAQYAQGLPDKLPTD